MIRTHMERLAQWLRRVVTKPRSELDRWQAAVRYAYDLGRYGARALRRDNAPQMAAALSFRTLFGFLPVLFVGTMLVRAIGGFEQFQHRLGEFFASLKLHRFQVSSSETDGTVSSLSDWLLGLIGQVEHMNLAAITWVGVAVLIYSAVSLMVTIENSFNNIYGAPEGRAWSRRMPIYWTILTLGPATLAMTVYVNSQFVEFATTHGGFWSVFYAAPVVWSCLATWLIMFAFYKLVPNTNVSYKPAVIGAFVAAVLIEIGKRSLGVYFSNAVSFSQLYGSLGLIPLFMFWVYLMWLVALFGLEVSATIQTLQGRKVDELEEKKQHTGLVDPAAILVLLEMITKRFLEGATITARQLSEDAAIPESAVKRMLDRLVEERILHRIDREDGAVSLARPPDQISAEKLIEIGFALVDEGRPIRPSALLERVREGQRVLARQFTAATLLSPSLATKASGQAKKP